jgi:hypothetical protein
MFIGFQGTFAVANREDLARCIRPAPHGRSLSLPPR